MPLHLNSIVKEEIHNELLKNILSKDSGTIEDAFIAEDKIRLNGIKNIIDKDTNEIIGKTIFTMKVNEEEKHIEVLDADIVLNNNEPTKLEFINKYEQSSDSIEYYQVSSENNSVHFDIETVGRYRIDEEIENTIQSVYLSAFPFQLNIYENIEELNKALGVCEPIKTPVNDLVVHGFSEEFMGEGSSLSDNKEPCSFVIGKIESYKDVNAIIGELEIPFTIINLKTAVGIIPVATSKDNFDLRNIKNGMILGMLVNIKAEIKEESKIEDEIKEAQSKLDMNKVSNIFCGGIEQMTNIAKGVNYYTNGKIKISDIYNLYIRDWCFFQIDGDVYSLYNHMKMRYGNILTDDEQINYAALILTNISNPNYKFEENTTLMFSDYIKDTIKTINANDSEGIMKGAYGVFGKESTNPIPVNGHNGLREYFKNLLLDNGNEFTYERLGQVSTSKDINGIVDLYVIKDKQTNKKVCDLHICIYNKYTSKLIPEGFKLKEIDSKIENINKRKEVVLKIEHIDKRNVDGGIIGSIRSINNIFRSNIIYKEINIHNTQKAHYYFEPIYKIISKPEEVQNNVSKINFNELKLLNEKCEEYSNYYRIQYVDGTELNVYSNKISDETKSLLDKIIENNEYSSNASEKYIEKAPFLNYINIDMKGKIKKLKELKNYIDNRKNKEFYNKLSEKCTFQFDDKKIMLINKKDIIKFLKKKFGIFNIKIFGFTSANLYGFLNAKKECDICLKVSFKFKNNNDRTYYFCDFEFDNNYNISKINIFNENEMIAKELNDIAIRYISNNEYDDFNEKMALDILSNNLTCQESLNKMFPNNASTTNLSDILLK